MRHALLLLACYASLAGQVPQKNAPSKQTSPPEAAPQEVSIRTYPYTPLSNILRADANLVETPLTVRDPKGRPVDGLTATDFQVFDNGAERQIVSFNEARLSQPGPAPKSGDAALAADSESRSQSHFVTFFFDDLHTSSGQMLFVKQGARAFIARGVAPGSHLSIVTTSGQGELDFTTDAEAFAQALEHLGPHPRPAVTLPCGVSPVDSYIFLHRIDGNIVEEAIAAAMNCASCSPHEPPAQCRSKALTIAESIATSTWEQVNATSMDTISGLTFAVKRLAQMNGSRTLALLSAGFLVRPGTPPEFQSVADAAIRSNVVIHAIGAQGLDPGSSGIRAWVYLAPLQNIANATGGHFFKNDNDLAAAMQQAAEPQFSYTLAFNGAAPDGKFHNIKIVPRTKNANELEYRPGYFSPDPKRDAPARAQLDSAVFSDRHLHEIPVTVALSAGQPRGAAIPISVHFTVDLKALQFAPSNGRQAQQLAFVAVLLDPNGAFLTGEESLMDLDLTPQKLDSLRRTGLKAIATLIAQPGIYKVRAVVREGVKGHIASTGSPIELKK